ncbi:hypothetical protein ABBQ32_007330 [Trebouxia sp. C0010 RCD-2024]
MPRFQDPLSELSGSDSDSDVGEDPRVDVARPQNKRKRTDKIDLQTLQQHGYKSGPSVLYVPAPQQAEQSWEWASGKDAVHANREDKDTETAQDREQTRAAATTGAEATAALSQKAMQQNLKLKAGKRAEQHQMTQERRQTFQQKEKRKREVGQAKSAKNYVEEEKRLARNFGMYSGFDT